jgi:hypothetical protein
MNIPKPSEKPSEKGHIRGGIKLRQVIMAILAVIVSVPLMLDRLVNRSAYTRRWLDAVTTLVSSHDDAHHRLLQIDVPQADRCAGETPDDPSVLTVDPDKGVVRCSTNPWFTLEIQGEITDDRYLEDLHSKTGVRWPIPVFPLVTQLIQGNHYPDNYWPQTGANMEKDGRRYTGVIHLGDQACRDARDGDVYYVRTCVPKNDEPMNGPYMPGPPKCFSISKGFKIETRRPPSWKRPVCPSLGIQPSPTP